MRKFSIIVAAVATLAASSVYAEASSSATGINFRYTLTDLDPTDGITPSLSFANGAAYNASAGAGVQLAGVDTTSVHYGASTFGPVASSESNAQSSASAAISGDGSLGGATLHAQGQSTPGPVATSYTATTTVLRPSAVVDPYASFTLSANTEVHFMLDVDLKAKSTNFHELATALAYFDIFDTTGRNYHAQLNADLFAMGNSEVKDLLEIYVGNFTGDAQTYYANVGVQAIGSVLAPVPEPATYALMLSGLVFVGWAAKRRSRQAKTAPR